MKKLLSLALAGLSFSSVAQGADIVPSSLYPVQDDLARPYLRLQNDWDLRIGAGFSEAERYVLNPTSRDAVESSSVRRSVNATLRLPLRFELGLMGFDGEEATAEEVENLFGANNGKHSGGAVWLRNYLIQSETFSTAIVLQHEPGSSDRRSFHTPSQDKTSLAFTVDYSPSAYAHLGAYFGGTTRNKERYYGKRLNDEILYGTRLAVGPSMIQLFADVEARAMPWKTAEGKTSYRMSQQYEAGLAANWRSLSFQASTYFPSTERFPGVPERGFSFAVQYNFGKGSSGAGSDAPVKASKNESVTTIKSQDNLEDLSSPTQEQELAPLNTLPDAQAEITRDNKPLDPINTTEEDEFQKWDQKASQEAKLSGTETDRERMERELAAQAALEKRNEEAKAVADAKAQAAEEARMNAEWEAEMNLSRSQQRDIENEINQYTLPDGEDVNWNGLNH